MLLEIKQHGSRYWDSLYEKLNSLNDMAGTLSGVNTALTNVSDKLEVLEKRIFRN